MTDVAVAHLRDRLPEPEPVDVATEAADVASPSRRPPKVHATTIVVVGISLSLVIAAALLARAAHRDSEQRLLDRQAAQAGAVLTSGINNIKGLLSQAADVAEATEGDPRMFDAVLRRSVPATFSSVSLWDSTRTEPEPVAVLGEPLMLADDPGRIAEVLRNTLEVDMIHTVGVLGPPEASRLAYAYSAEGVGERYVVYVERALPADRRAVTRSDNAFSNLDFALYVDESESDDALLIASVEDLPITGRRATAEVDFGGQKWLLVATPRGSLTGRLPELLPWVVLLFGTFVTLGVGALIERLLRRRDAAEATSQALAVVSDENARLYAEQLRIAETLQRSLLPDRLAHVPNTSVAARYWPAGLASEVGGDFYDLFELGDGRWGLAIGDVCGKGVKAAALTGAARHTIRAAARHVDSPAEVLRWVHEAILAKQASTFCTVCFAVVTLDGDRPARIDVSLGGHPPPLLCRADGSSEEIGVIGTVLGLIEPTLTDASYELRPGDTLVLFTDGLTDAPQDLAVPVVDLQRAHAAAPQRSPDEVAESIRRLLELRRPLGSGDDTALLVLHLAAE